ncbi:MAG: hypothetical protein ACRDUA_09320 [Micromonosporaceae bacterium]
MTDPDTWTPREVPVLKATADLLEQAPVGRFVSSRDVAEATGIDHDQVTRALDALSDRHIEARPDKRRGGVNVLRLTPAGRIDAGMWPSPEALTERLLASIDDHIERATPEEKSKLERLRDAARGMGRDLLVDVVAAIATRGIQ